MSIKIRKSIPDDVYAIQNVRRETWIKTYPNREEGITLEDIISKFADDQTSIGQKRIEKEKQNYKDKNIQRWVAEVDYKIIAFCNAGTEKNHNRIFAVYVLPDYQNKGIGTLLINEAFNWLKKGKAVYVNVARYNKQAINFYGKHGFVKTGKGGVFDPAAKLSSGKTIMEIEMKRKKTASKITSAATRLWKWALPLF